MDTIALYSVMQIVWVVPVAALQHASRPAQVPVVPAEPPRLPVNPPAPPAWPPAPPLVPPTPAPPSRQAGIVQVDENAQVAMLVPQVEQSLEGCPHAVLHAESVQLHFEIQLP